MGKAKSAKQKKCFNFFFAYKIIENQRRWEVTYFLHLLLHSTVIQSFFYIVNGRFQKKRKGGEERWLHFVSWIHYLWGVKKGGEGVRVRVKNEKKKTKKKASAF